MTEAGRKHDLIDRRGEKTLEAVGERESAKKQKERMAGCGRRLRDWEWRARGQMLIWKGIG